MEVPWGLLEVPKGPLEVPWGPLEVPRWSTGVPLGTTPEVTTGEQGYFVDLLEGPVTSILIGETNDGYH